MSVPLCLFRRARRVMTLDPDGWWGGRNSPLKYGTECVEGLELIVLNFLRMKTHGEQGHFKYEVPGAWAIKQLLV